MNLYCDIILSVGNLYEKVYSNIADTTYLPLGLCR